MQDCIIEKKNDSLGIVCKSGYISLEGNCILSDPKKFFQPVVDWISFYSENLPDKTEVDLKFNYVDSASVTCIFDLLKRLCASSKACESVNVNWYYELDDPELLEIGEIMEGRLPIKFNFLEHYL